MTDVPKKCWKKVKVLLTRIAAFFSKKGEEDPTLTLLSLIKRRDLTRINVRVRMQNSISTYSRDITQLLAWITQANTTMREDLTVPASWRKIDNVLEARNLDDYLLDDGRDQDLVETFDKLQLEVSEFYRISSDTAAASELRGLYYQRVFTPIQHDIEAVLKTLQRLT